MKYKWSGLAVMAGGLFLMMGTAPGCVVRARVRPAVVVVDESPPEPQYEAEPAPRVGYVWVRGHWEYRNGRWNWSRGYWKAERRGYVWVPGHWERRGNRHHWVAGHWQQGGAAHVRPRPTPPPPDTGGAVVSGGIWIDVAPPAPKAEPPPAARSGYVWVSGRWEWRNGNWKWKRGRWEQVRSGYVWVPGYWDRQGNRYRWVEGHWEVSGGARGGGVERRDHRKKDDEPEEVKSRRGRPR